MWIIVMDFALILLTGVLLCSIVSASGIYKNPSSIKPINRKSSVEAKKIVREENPLWKSGGPLPPITRDPHLAEIDEKFSKCNGIDIRELTIHQIQNFFMENKLTSLVFTKCYIERIKRLNPVLRAVNEINPDALNQAAKVDIERKLGRQFSLMHGIPVLLKENIGTNDRMETTAGSPALIGIRPKGDADVVKALRKAGAIILGKANLSEFAYIRGTNIPSGWSGRGKQTRNAYNLSVSPEGSSSGSAVSISANLAVVAVGHETDGSMITPANVAGIFALKPTHGLVSIKGVIPVSRSQDHVGPMARTAVDSAILLDAMIDENRRHFRHRKSFSDSILKNKRNRFRIGIMRHPFFNTSVINSTNLKDHLPQINQLIGALKANINFQILDPLSPEVSLLKNISGKRQVTVIMHDFKHGFDEYLRTEVIGTYRKIGSLKDVIQYNEDNPTEGYNQELLVMSQATDGITNKTYIKYRDMNRDASRKFLDSLLKTYNLDAVMTPSNPCVSIDPELRDNPVVGYNIADVSGYPSIHVGNVIPLGIGLRNVPFGITLIGAPYSEAVLLQIGNAIERLTPKRRRPTFLI